MNFSERTICLVDTPFNGTVPDDDAFLPEPLPSPFKEVICALYVVIICLAVTGNTCVILVILRHKALQTVTNSFLLSLAIGDLGTAILNVPFSLLFYMRNEWLFSAAWCKACSYLQAVFIVCTILTLTVIAIDR